MEFSEGRSLSEQERAPDRRLDAKELHAEGEEGDHKTARIPMRSPEARSEPGDVDAGYCAESLSPLRLLGCADSYVGSAGWVPSEDSGQSLADAGPAWRF